MISENTPTLETLRLILRKLTRSASDMNAMFAILSDEKTNIFLPWFPLTRMEEVQKHVQERYFDFYAKESAYRYVICLKEDNVPIGYVGLSNDESRDFGYALLPSFWHRGIVTEAAHAVAEQIRRAGYEFITATHDVNNPRSGEVMKKIGMKYCYSYVEPWMPKNIRVTFRMYQLNFDGLSQISGDLSGSFHRNILNLSETTCDPQTDSVVIPGNLTHLLSERL